MKSIVLNLYKTHGPGLKLEDVERHIGCKETTLREIMAVSTILGVTKTRPGTGDIILDEVVRALRETGGVQKHAAEILGISPRAINHYVHKYNIEWAKGQKKVEAV